MEKAPDAFRTISEVSEDLDVPQHVLRFWESRFAQIKPMKRGGGRRYYRPDDVDLLRGIRHLLYGEGYTIRGVQRILKEQGIKFVQVVWQEGAPQPAHGPGDDADVVEEAPADDRGRGIFGLLPSFLAPDGELAEADDTESDLSIDEDELRPAKSRKANSHRHAADFSASAPDEVAGVRLTPEELQRLEATLHELGECKRLLEEAVERA
ncbi:MAG TPA: MerR family transcriptional regulator [Xanthobacteraceae bacterium]|nr:MerR family transcriptional regulator [Xanthobacteraceae bacterium]